jgi:hypothetical protein
MSRWPFRWLHRHDWITREVPGGTGMLRPDLLLLP